MAILKAPNCGCQTVRDYKNWADLQNGQIGCEIGHFGCNQTPPKPFSRLFQDFIKTLLDFSILGWTRRTEKIVENS